MGSSRGSVTRRWEKILRKLKEHKIVYVNELAEELNVSLMTIRRDLQTFEDEQIVERFYGGARLIEHTLQIEPVPEQKYLQNTEVKQSIAKAAA